MAEISELWVYPVKGLLGVSLPSARMEARGLEFDRRWMLIGDDARFISQRDDASLTQFQVKLTKDGVEVRRPDAGRCVIPTQAKGDTIMTHVWNADMPAQLVDPEVDAWFSNALQRNIRVVVLPENSDRRVNPRFGDYPVGFADGMPVLVLSESSVEELNTRVPEDIPANRFRANIILKGTRAFEEDDAAALVAGDVRLVATKRCGRCLVTCTDQETGVRGVEPLKTLAEYRLYDQNACMGMYYAPESFGTIEVGQSARLV